LICPTAAAAPFAGAKIAGFWTLRLAWLLPVAAGAFVVASAAEPAAQFDTRIEQGGLALEASLARAPSAGARDGPLRSDEAVTVRFRVSDRTGKPITGAFPNGWMMLHGPDGGGRADTADARCRRTLQLLQISSLPDQAEVDLNTFLVLALNDDATVSVIDPRSGFGGTRLLGLPALDGVGEDWIQLVDQERLAVTVPDADAVDIVDMRSWNAPIQRVAVAAKPRRLVLQPDRAYFWVDAVDPATGAAAALAVNADTLAASGRISIGDGPHDFAFTSDSRYLFVANAGAGTVSVIDVGAFKPIAEIATGPRPVSLAFSELANAVYVADADDGSVTVLDARAHTMRARIAGAPGVTQIRFAEGGRFGFVINKRADTVTVIDSSRDRAMHTIETPPGQAPDQVSFTSTMAYLRQSISASVLMVPLDQIAGDGGKPPMLEFPAGTKAPAATQRPTPAAGIASTGDRAVVVANASDREIYYYQEGLAVPMGSFSNYKRVPRAVMVVRRDLRETEPGVYQTTAKLGRPGSYDLVFRLNQPALYHCFPFEVAPASGAAARQPPRVVPARPFAAVPAGQSVSLDFVVTDPATGEVVAGLTDLTVLVMTPAWQTRQVARPLGNGRYEVNVVVPEPGTYAVAVRSEAAGIHYEPMPGLNITQSPQ
jgi:YVTN family beta-propeller protein